MKCEDRFRPTRWWTWQRLFLVEAEHMGFPWVFPLCWSFFCCIGAVGFWVIENVGQIRYLIRRTKCIFIPLFSGQAFRAKKLCLSFCWCAGVTQEWSAFCFDKCTGFLSGICQCAKLPVHAQLYLTHIGRCFSFYLIESGGIIESVTLPSCCAWVSEYDKGLSVCVGGWGFCSKASMTHLSTMWLMNHCSSVGCAFLINLSVAPFSLFLFLYATPSLSSLTLLLTTSRHLFGVSLFQAFLLLITISLVISLGCHFLCLPSLSDSVSLIFCFSFFFKLIYSWEIVAVTPSLFPDRSCSVVVNNILNWKLLSLGVKWLCTKNFFTLIMKVLVHKQCLTDVIVPLKYIFFRALYSKRWMINMIIWIN